jgi:hypothetical protein
MALKPQGRPHFFTFAMMNTAISIHKIPAEIETRDPVGLSN